MTGSRASLAPEAELLLLTAAAAPSDAALRHAVDSGLDWEALSDLAQHEKATPVLVRQLGRLGVAIPGSEDMDLRQLATASVMNMLHLERLLFQTLDGLAARGIPVMLLKGAALAYSVYPSITDRPMGDLDILLPPEHAEPAWTWLQTQGWTWPEARWAAGQYTTLHHLPPLVQDPGEYRLEIHRDLLPEGHPFRFSAETMWARAERVTVKGRVFTVPHPMHQLWHLCVHFAWSHQMMWGTWRTLRDGAQIVQRAEFPWDSFIELARESRAGTCCYWTLRLARRLAAAAVPDAVLQALLPPRAPSILDALERHYVSNLFPSQDGCPSVWLASRLWEAGMAPGWSQHGDARPWQVTERWLAGAEQPPVTPGERSLWARLRKMPLWLAYLRRIYRFALPATAP